MNKRCLVPKPCSQMKTDHSDYIRLLEAIEAVPGVKKVFIRSGIRFDYMMADKKDDFFRKLVRDHVSGQLKVAPEHCADRVLACMGKPEVAVYDAFRAKFHKLSEEAGLKQFLVPYLMSSHPGSTLDDAIELALYTKRIGLSPEQVQDFYPTPGTASTVMYYTGIDPFTMKEVYTPTDYGEKRLQRALLQWRRPENRALIREGLIRAGREDALRELLGGRSAPGGRSAASPKKDAKKSAPAGKGGRSYGEKSTQKKGKSPDKITRKGGAGYGTAKKKRR